MNQDNDNQQRQPRTGETPAAGGIRTASSTAATSAPAASMPAAAQASANASATVTMTETEEQTEAEVLRLTLAARPTVRWDESVMDNEGMGRKSSKRCCIFHKQRSFGESSTDSSDYDSDRSGSSAASGNDGDGEDKKMKPKGPRKNRKIARPKKGNDVPDYQRFHA